MIVTIANTGNDCPTGIIQLVPQNPDYLEVDPADVYLNVAFPPWTSKFFQFDVRSLEYDGIHHGQAPDEGGTENGNPKLGYELEIIDGVECTVSGSISAEQLCLTPSGETVWRGGSEYDAASNLPQDADGWGNLLQFANTYLYGSTLEPSNASFEGRKVKEKENLVTDQCYDLHVGPNPHEHCAVSGWTPEVQSELYMGNSSGQATWAGYDQVGWLKAPADYYRASGDAPCACLIEQGMAMECPNEPGGARWFSYATNVLSMEIDRDCQGAATTSNFVANEKAGKCEGR